MSEIGIDFQNGEQVEVITKTAETRTRWSLRNIEFDPEQKQVVLTFYGAVNGKVIHKSRCLSIKQDPETMKETGFWLDNAKEIDDLINKVLEALEITKVIEQVGK